MTGEFRNHAMLCPVLKSKIHVHNRIPEIVDSINLQTSGYVILVVDKDA